MEQLPPALVQCVCGRNEGFPLFYFVKHTLDVVVVVVDFISNSITTYRVFICTGTFNSINIKSKVNLVLQKIRSGTCEMWNCKFWSVFFTLHVQSSVLRLLLGLVCTSLRTKASAN